MQNLAQLTDLEQVRKIRNRRKRIHGLIMLALLAVVIFSISFFLHKMGNVNINTLTGDIKATMAKGDGYPVAIPGGKISALSGTGNMLVMLSDTNIYTYNDTGKQMLNAQHGMSKPGMCVSQEKTMLFDRGGTKVSIYSRGSLGNTKSMPFTIYDADMNGATIAMATSSDEYLSCVTVYNNAFEKIYGYSTNDPIISVSASGARSSMAVASIGTKDGAYNSTIKRFQFSIEKEMAQTELHGELVLKLNYHMGSSIRVITDKRAVILNGDLKETSAFDYDGLALKRYAFRNDGSLVLLLGAITGTRTSEIVLLSPDFSLLGRIPVKDKVTAMAVDDNYVYVASKGFIRIYGKNGALKATMTTGNVHYMYAMGGTLYYVTGSELDARSVSDIIDGTVSSSKITEDGAVVAPGGVKEESKSESSEGSSNEQSTAEASSSRKTDVSSSDISSSELSSPPSESSPESSPTSSKNEEENDVAQNAYSLNALLDASSEAALKEAGSKQENGKEFE